MADDAVTTETPYQRAQSMAAQGFTAAQVRKTLVAEGMDAESATIATSAAFGASGQPIEGIEPPVAAPSRGEDAPAPAPQAAAPANPCPTHARWPVTGTCTRCGSFFCAQCERDAPALLDAGPGLCPACRQRGQGDVQLNGWLVLPGLQLVAQPLLVTVGLVQTVNVLWGRVAAPLVAPLVVDVVIRLASVIFSIVVAVAFFGRKRRAVPLCVAWYVAGIAVSLALTGTEAWVLELVGSPKDDFNGVGLGRSVFFAVLWIAYFLNSKRVAATFTRE